MEAVGNVVGAAVEGVSQAVTSVATTAETGRSEGEFVRVNDHVLFCGLAVRALVWLRLGRKLQQQQQQQLQFGVTSISSPLLTTLEP